MWSGEIFLRNFLPYPPPNIPGLKGGGSSNAAKPRLESGYAARHQEAPGPMMFHLQTGLKRKHMRQHVRGNHEALHLQVPAFRGYVSPQAWGLQNT